MNPVSLIMQRRAESYRDGKLDMWVVYNAPKDIFPAPYVVRRFVLDQPTKDAFSAATLEEIREPLIEAGFVCLARNDSDDPVIVETWL